MIIFSLVVAVYVGILLNAYFVKSKLWDEKMKSYSQGWDDGFIIGWGESPNLDPTSEHRDDELKAIKAKKRGA